MKISRNWLQTYFKEKLPAADKLAELFTFHAFEVEEVLKLSNDEVIDVKVLPDRAHYALSHQGVAREVAAVTGLSLKHKEASEVAATNGEVLNIRIKEPKLCRRYIGRRINNISVGASPAWLKEYLEAVGQRSINTIVDATNFIMLDLGQPLHAFDANKVKGDIVVRKAHEGEMIGLLPEKTVQANGEVVYKERELMLDGTELVIADDDGPLALAGIKGGLRAAVREETKNIILESANFDPVSIRKTSTKFALRNDSSKRFENEISPELAREAMSRISALIFELNLHAHAGEVVDVYPEPAKPWSVSVTADYVSRLLGAAYSEDEICAVASRMSIAVSREDKNLICHIPYWRLDLKIPEDIAEEVGRIYGYEKIKPALPPAVSDVSINKTFYWSEKIKDILVELGYSEVYTYVLTDHGDAEIYNPLARDKGFLRANLHEGIERALVFNSRNAPLLGLEEIKIFEIGNVFTKGLEENLSLSIGYYSTKNFKNKAKASFETLENVVKKLGEKLSVEISGVMESTESGVVFEANLTDLIEKLPEPTVWDVNTPTHAVTYAPISAYPFVLRDIAVFVPEGVSEQDLVNIIKKHSGSLLKRHTLFDVFHKQMPDGTKKTSYAFHLVFESGDRTLTDEEINSIMNLITEAVNSTPGWQVR